jgi:YidC/Oxa1 family membrane protein insertase
MEQKRLLIAVALSAVILLGWSYFFPPTNPQQNTNTSQPTPTSTPTPQPVEQLNQATPQNSAAATSEDSIPHRTLTVSTPLYEVVFDSHGAVARSWIIKRNKDANGQGKPLYSVASTKENPLPLQLIPQEYVNKDKGPIPLEISTGHAELDALFYRNFEISDSNNETSNPQIDLKPGEQKSVEFVMSEPMNAIEVRKKLTFDADNYTVKAEIKALRDGQPIPDAKISIGPSIGDQGVPRYTFYSIAPEGIVAVGEDSPSRFTASQVEQAKESPNYKKIDGPVQWLGIGDTYFAMTLIPQRPAPGAEFRTKKYEHLVNGQKEDRYLITGYLPIPTDGSPMYLFTGPKDHDQLQEISTQISKNLGRPVDLGQLINYGWTRRVTQYLATPILWSIKHLNRLTGSYGLAIILFTIIIYMLFFPLKWRSSKSMKKAQKLAPRMKELQEKIKGMKQSDPRLKELQMEQLHLMKEGNPLGGCLPLLIQMPFLIALYVAITISIDFRQSSFLWIPDLSAAEPYSIHILPLLMAGSMLVLQLITPAPSADPLQRRMMAVVMPLMMLYILWSAPAGLLVYWLVGNLVGFGQQILINRMLKSEDDEEQPPAEKNQTGSRSKKKLSNAGLTQA